MTVFNLFFSTLMTTAQPYGAGIAPVDKSNLANVSWVVNWDNLIQSEVKDVSISRNCLLRYRLISSVNSTSLSTTANTGYLSIAGLSTNKQPANIPSVFLGLISPELIPLATPTYRFNESTLEDANGIEINMPTGNQQLTVRYYNDDAMTLQANVPEYVLHLQLEVI